jgi:transposase-like protein
LDYMFHGSCRKVSKVLSIALEPISKSAVHYLAKRVSEISVAKEPRYRRCIAVDETKLCVKKSYVYIWSAVDVDSKELLALEASYGRSSLNALSFLKKALRMCPLLRISHKSCLCRRRPSLVPLCVCSPSFQA